MLKVLPLLVAVLTVMACRETGTAGDSEGRQGVVRQIQMVIRDFVNGTPTGNHLASGDESYHATWTETDTVGVFTDEGSPMTFPMAGWAGSRYATYDCREWGLKTRSTYSAYSPLRWAAYSDRRYIPISITGQRQKGNHSRHHLGRYDYMAAIDSTRTDSTVVTLEFSHLTAVLHLRITMPRPATYTALILTTDGGLATDATLDLTSGITRTTTQSGVLRLQLDETTLTDGCLELEAFLSLLPADQAGHRLQARVYDTAGHCYVAMLDSCRYEAGAYYVYSRKAEPAADATGLPLMVVNTPRNQPVMSKTDWTEGATITIIDTLGNIVYDSDGLQIRGRGNSSWGYPKKPYALKLESSTGLLGMKANRRWCLLANWMDRTLLRNDAAFHIARQTQLAWTPSGQYVELVMNGKHLGNYYLCEQIRVGKGRLQLTEMSDADTTGMALTGGYLMEMDVNYDEQFKFRSAVFGMPYMFKAPDDDVLQPAQLAYMEGFIDSLEHHLSAADWLTTRKYADHMDVESFIDWWIVNELAMNSEAYHPKSAFVYKDRLGKLTAGPVWDFDWGTFMPEKVGYYAARNAIYYERLFDDPVVVDEARRRWMRYKPLLVQVPAYIRSRAAQLRRSDAVNHLLWPYTEHPDGIVNGDQDLSYDEAVERLVDVYVRKLQWLDDAIMQRGLR